MAAAGALPCPEAGADAFHVRGGELWCEEVPLASLAARFGTPLHVYSAATMDERLARVQLAFGTGANVCYAVKANPNLSLLARMHARGAGFDLVSGGELHRLAAANVPASRSVFAGVGKEPWEIEAAVAAGLLFFNVESPHEVPLLAAAAARHGSRIRVALRLNPDVAAGGHSYISTARKGDKFGVAIDVAAPIVESIVREPSLHLCGYHVHLGSQVLRPEPYGEALAKVAAFVDGAALRREGVTHYDLGGGFGIGYGRGHALDVDAVARSVLPTLRSRGWTPVVEPGRYLVGDAGVLLTTVLGEKRQGGTDFVLVDAAMNDLLRPALYQAEHPIVAVRPRDGARREVDVVGPICETSDFLGRRRALPPCRAGDLLAVLSAGAYGASMASNYNTRRRAAEVLVDGGAVRLVRRRETFPQLFANEVHLDDESDGTVR
ncbi:MAG: diaminopimelate decarboxylase [Planctomycetes bacterium]|nr:diaminopimelate decarboxylase [Planctomycetota bacterium]